MRLNLLGACHPDCTFCARDWFKWYKARMESQERVPSKAAKRGDKTPFNHAAATSIGARRV